MHHMVAHCLSNGVILQRLQTDGTVAQSLEGFLPYFILDRQGGVLVKLFCRGAGVLVD